MADEEETPCGSEQEGIINHAMAIAFNEAKKRDANLNQCDGCRRGLPLVDGIHKGEDYDMISCTQELYIQG